MKKEKEQNYECYHCGAFYLKWVGRCSRCDEWNTLKPVEKISPGTLNSEPAEISQLDKVEEDATGSRLNSQVQEFDRVLGGGIMEGSVGIIGGNPGVGKSTLILQLVAKYASLNIKTLYVSGEESIHQIKNRASRLELKQDKINIMAETSMEKIFNGLRNFKPNLVFIDSIHTMKTETIPSAAGSINQVREISAMLVSYAKTHNVAIVLIGHVTKDGYLAGPKTLEHIVDYAIYLDGDKNTEGRILRAVKNRFGALKEIGLFKMTEKGLAESKNSNRHFLDQFDSSPHGTAVYPYQEGSRLLLVEVQALVAEKKSEYFARTSIGIERNKLLMLIAVLEKYLGLQLQGRDIYINISGGFKSNLPTIDMAVLAAILSSHRKISLGTHSVFWGEVTLTGEFRSTMAWENPVHELARSGFKKIFQPARASKVNSSADMEILPVKNVVQLAEYL